MFLDKGSYWFATILYRRFIRDGAQIMFNENDMRFATKIRGKIYDISGNIPNGTEWVAWVDVENDELKSKIMDHIII